MQIFQLTGTDLSQTETLFLFTFYVYESVAYVHHMYVLPMKGRVQGSPRIGVSNGS